MLRLIFYVAIVFTNLNEASAQGLLIQAPVIARFSVSTSVSVPDRGSALLGSVGRAADGYKSYGPGPFPRGSSRGRSISHRSMRSHVYIHDFSAMDPFLRSRVPQPVDPATENNARIARAAKAYATMAEKFEKRGKSERARWYRQKAAEYEARAAANQSGVPR